MTEVRSRGLVGLVLSFGMLACGPEGGSENRAPTESTHERLTPITATWTAEGPGPIIQGQVENLASNPAGFPTMNPNGNQVTGAIHAIVAHPTDPNRIVIGAVNGGIWTTDNALTNPPTWTPRTDLAASPSIGALAIDPTNPNVLLAGFGATSSFNRVAGTLAGLDSLRRLRPNVDEGCARFDDHTGRSKHLVARHSRRPHAGSRHFLARRHHSQHRRRAELDGSERSRLRDRLRHGQRSHERRSLLRGGRRTGHLPQRQRRARLGPRLRPDELPVAAPGRLRSTLSEHHRQLQ